MLSFSACGVVAGKAPDFPGPLFGPDPGRSHVLSHVFIELRKYLLGTDIEL